MMKCFQVLLSISTCAATPRIVHRLDRDTSGCLVLARNSATAGPGTRVIENNVSTARSTFARVWVNAHTDARTRFVIADRPQTILWAFTLSLANVDLAV